MKPTTFSAKGWRTTITGCCAMLVICAVAITTHDIGIIASVSGAITTILGMVSQRHTTADLYASAPVGGHGHHAGARTPLPTQDTP